MSIGVHVLCQEWAVQKQQLGAVAWKRARSLHIEDEAVSCCQIDLRDTATPYLPDLATVDFFSS
jgi:NADH:ubiquinone oxidoreductase subunit B-like Fe-S oxidoreductase